MANTSVGYTCPNCGGPLSFSPGAARVTCPYCDTEFETAKIEEILQSRKNGGGSPGGKGGQMAYGRRRR